MSGAALILSGNSINPGPRRTTNPSSVARLICGTLTASGFVKFFFNNDTASCKSAALSESISSLVFGFDDAAGGAVGAAGELEGDRLWPIACAMTETLINAGRIKRDIKMVLQLA